MTEEMTPEEMPAELEALVEEARGLVVHAVVDAIDKMGPMPWFTERTAGAAVFATVLGAYEGLDRVWMEVSRSTEENNEPDSALLTEIVRFYMDNEDTLIEDGRFLPLTNIEAVTKH